MKVLIKRFRKTLYFLILLVITILTGVIFEGGDTEGFCLSLAMFIWFPLVFISYIKYWILAIKDLINYSKGYAWPKDEPAGEVQFFRNRINSIKKEVAILKELPLQSRIIRIALGILGIVILIIGIVIIVDEMYVAGVLTIILGSVLWFVRHAVDK